MTGYYFDHQEDSNRDYPLTFRWHAPELAASLGLPPAPDAEHKFVRDTILAELMLAAEAGKPLSFSRHKPFYKRSRYRSPAYTYATTMTAVAEIVNFGVAIENRTRPGHRGWQSTLMATPALFGMGDDPIIYNPSGETIILRGRGEDHRLIEYRDTPTTRRLRDGVAAVNEMLASTMIGVNDGIRVGNHLIFERLETDGTVKRQYVRVVPGNGGRRIFTENWSLHGRFYCWPQNIPSAARAAMTINGEPVVELDYTAMHPTLAYSLAGQKLDGDPYDVGGGFDRKDVKIGLLIALNARNLPAAVAATAKARKMTYASAAMIIEAIKCRHKRIEGSICADAGIRLMNHDAKIMMAVTTGLLGAGISSVPVHDSTIVPARFAGQAEAKMMECWSSYGSRINHCCV